MDISEAEDRRDLAPAFDRPKLQVIFKVYRPTAKRKPHQARVVTLQAERVQEIHAVGIGQTPQEALLAAAKQWAGEE